MVLHAKQNIEMMGFMDYQKIYISAKVNQATINDLNFRDLCYQKQISERSVWCCRFLIPLKTSSEGMQVDSQCVSNKIRCTQTENHVAAIKIDEISKNYQGSKLHHKITSITPIFAKIDIHYLQKKKAFESPILIAYKLQDSIFKFITPRKESLEASVLIA